MLYRICFIAFFSAVHTPAFSQLNTGAQAMLDGTWKGTSICQARGSSCNDEVVVYHISRVKQTDSFEVVMNKIVNDKEENMGTLVFKFNRNKKMLSTIYRQTSFWEFSCEDETVMQGTLVYNRELYRVIKLNKVK